MTILSHQTILIYQNTYGMIDPFVNEEKTNERNISYGLGPAGYTIRTSEPIYIKPSHLYPENVTSIYSLEYLKIPDDIKCRVCDKSFWARQYLSIFNTNIQPGWQGFLLIEMVWHGNYELTIPEGTPIAEIEFHKLDEPTNFSYKGKYQYQRNNKEEPSLGNKTSSFEELKKIEPKEFISDIQEIPIKEKFSISKLFSRKR